MDRSRTGITGKPVKKVPRDAKEHIIIGGSDTGELIDDLREEVSILREALIRTHTIRTKLEDDARETKADLISTGDEGLLKLAHKLFIPEVDPFVAEVVERALIIDSGRNCENSCEYGYCIGSTCPMYSIID